ncbi:selenoneine biosynthesis selenosugar synthase SenB [Ramlibacter sp. MAHUQ-53]|uniref:selenoneine biosynthesis selenosugar synthase SenB n=1 Tax=unclassified Ramlibacter TaxID=2617605 RepID=UPI003637A3C8
MPRPSIALVSPALEDANNGNWRTAKRWRQLLARTHNVRILTHWPDEHAERDVALLALHARRSSAAIRAWDKARGPQGLAVVLTGTDLYHDIFSDRRAKQSLESAQRLVVLQEQGLQALPPPVRAKARVIYQSAPASAPKAKSPRLLRAVMVGHMRSVKSPQTLMQAARQLEGRNDIRIDHIGEALDPEWAEAAIRTEVDVPTYRWLGGLSHARARLAIARAHVLVITSAMEGGAHVVLEAVRSGTPVLASRVGGNVGMLGADYAGYFPHDDAARLAALLRECRDTQADPAGLLARLRGQCALRAPLFEPEAERAALLQLLQDLQDPATP